MINLKKQIKLFTILKTKKISDAILKINDNKMKTVFVLDNKNQKYIGSITDGDLRRGMLKNFYKNQSVMKVVNKKSIFFKKKPSYSKLEKTFQDSFVQCIPLLDAKKKIQEIFVSTDFIFNQKLENTVIILAGGKGKRLWPITKKVPKPMIKINGKPIICHLLDKFQASGFKDFIICVKYKSSLIKNFFKNKKKIYPSINFSNEGKFLGTAGSFINAKKKINKSLPFFVCNGDIVTNVNFFEILNFHNDNNADITILSKFYEQTNKYGVIKNKGIFMQNIEEKPKIYDLINCGVYVISPNLLKFYGQAKNFDMTDFINYFKKKRKKIILYPAHELWMDIGTKIDLKKSRKLINQNRKII